MDSQIGPYRIESELGRGGMGVVYRAIDTTLDRTVAIKALPAELANDAGRLERFEREAKTLAQLNHPNLAGIHGLEHHTTPSGDATYLVLEFVEGETLADRLDRGAMETDEAVELAVQIAAGVEAAHEAGVVHRDLKPANIIVTPEGQAKVLDFGLAKADGGQSSAGSGMSQSPTMTAAIPQNSPTMPGVILGTAAYMSPEQARGRRVDKRSDIWSFGVILYEMLTGSSPFVGETASDSIGAVLHKEFNLDRLPPTTPSNVRRVLRRCLERDKNLRYQDIGDARIELQLQEAEAAPVAAAAGGGNRGLAAAGWVVGVVALAGLAVSMFQPSPIAVRPERFDADLLPGTGLELMRGLAPIRLSPNGQRLAYLGFQGEDPVRKLIVRDLQTGAETVLRGPESPSSFSWESDSKHLVYIADTRAERISVEGGRVEGLGEVGQVGLSYGSQVTPNGGLAFSKMHGTLWVFDPKTRLVNEVIDTIPGRGGDYAIGASFFPDGEHVLYLNQDDVTVDSGLYFGSVETGESKRLLPYETSARVIGDDGVLYFQDGLLYFQRFDLTAKALVGQAVEVAGPVYSQEWPMFASFDATEDTLAYLAAREAQTGKQLYHYDLATGEETPLGEKGSLWNPTVSPDGTRVALDRTVDATAGDIAVIDLETGVETMLSRDQSNESSPKWSRDGRWVYFWRGPDIYRVRSDGSGSPEPVIESSGDSHGPIGETPDGRSLVYWVEDSVTGHEIMVLDLKTGVSTPWLATETTEKAEAVGFLPGSDWFAYISDLTGDLRVYARRFNGEGAPVELARVSNGISTLGGDSLYFFRGTNIMSVRVTVTPGGVPEVAEPKALMPSEGIKYISPFPDGSGLILNRAIGSDRGGRMKVIKNWMPQESTQP